MKGGKTISFSAESSKPAEGGGILAGENGVGAMHPLASPVNAQAPSEHLQLAAEGENKRPRLEEGFYELEAIRKKRMRQGKVQYLIKWRGWPESANTWEPHENLSSCPDVVAAFERRSRAHSRKRSRCGRKRKLSATLTTTEMGLPHSAAAAKVTPQTKTRRRQHASAPSAMDIIHTAAADTTGIETRNMPCHSSAAAKDNVPARKGIPLVAVPFPCLDDSSIENHRSNDVFRPKVSGSSRGQNEHPSITNGSSLEKSIADSEETQILGACLPPGFSKSNIRKPIRSGRCARPAPRATRKAVGSATKGIPLVAVPFRCLDDSSIENHVSNDVCRPKVSGSSRARNEHPLITNGSSLENSVADSEETQILGACLPPGFSKSNIGKPVRSGCCARSVPRAIRKTVGSARKFTGNSSAHTSDDTQDPIRTTCSNMTAFGKDGFENVTINEIIRALICQASVSRGVLTFEAKRSDGKVVRVTDDFLKANNLHLLLSFYKTYFLNTSAAGMQGSGNRY